MKPMFVTLTGIDAKTDLDRVADLSAQYPVEWGILFSPARQGQENRYPALDVIEAALDREADYAAHLCGGYARQIMEGTFDIASLPLTGFRRIQVNHTSPDPEKIASLSNQHEVIAQWRNGERFDNDTCAWLYDPSGGRGIDAPQWPVNETKRPMGYAGGIGPDNVLSVISQINSPPGYWIDMETKIRTDDWLDLDKCEAVLSSIYDPSNWAEVSHRLSRDQIIDFYEWLMTEPGARERVRIRTGIEKLDAMTDEMLAHTIASWRTHSPTAYTRLRAFFRDDRDAVWFRVRFS